MMYAQAAACSQDSTLCGSHGRCVDNTCVCEKSPDRGFWTGTQCNECESGWATSDCRTECRGGSCNTCNAHGTCNQGTGGDGSCSCYSDAVKGYWDGLDCTKCAANYFGPGCDRPCPGVEATAEACYGRGICLADVLGNGLCTCTGGWGSETGCFECDAAHYGAGCANECPGYDATTDRPCSGHGTCFNGTLANGTCLCAEDYGTRDCSVKCPNSCGGTNGECLDGADRDATCVCHENFALPDCLECEADRIGPNCDIPCGTGPNGLICSGAGNCTYSTIFGPQKLCSCAAGYNGSECQVTCPGSPPCSGHGQCVEFMDGRQPLCSCFRDSVRGYWAGDACETCTPQFNKSTDCTRACPMANGLPCNGHGQCVDGTCFCDRNLQQEWCMADCSQSAIPGAANSLCATTYCRDIGIFGPTCESSCPGRVGTLLKASCSGHGYCSEGIRGSGLCTCVDGYAGPSCNLKCANNTGGVICSGFARGRCEYNTTTLRATCACRARFAGVACAIDCPTRAGIVCAGHGTCNSGYTGDGACSCAAGWTGVGCDVPCLCNSNHGTCDHKFCANLTSGDKCRTCMCTGNFTGYCDECKNGTQGENCEDVCLRGRTVGKKCICEENWSTASCSVPCPVDPLTGRICSGNGTCNSGATQSGTCSCFPRGQPTYFGPVCLQKCTVELCRRRTPYINPQCNPATGVCECQDNTQGHWSGDVCAVCMRGYWGPACKEECQCSGHGSCDMNTGECECFASAELGYYSGQNCNQCANGYIGQNCERRNLLITRLQRLNETSVTLEPAYDGHTAAGAEPAPTVLMVDSKRRTLVAGGVPVYTFDISTTVMREIGSSAGTSATVPTTAAPVGAPQSADCPVEVFYTWTDDTYIYYLTQPSLTCNRVMRILRRERTASGSVNLNVLDKWLWSRQNTTLRIRAASALTDAKLAIVVVVLVQTSEVGGRGDQWPGGFVLRIDPLAAFTTGSDESPVTEVQLPDDFLATSIVNANVLLKVGEENSETVAVSGTVDGLWEVLFYKRSTTAFGPAAQGASTPGLRSQVQCWPAVGSGVGGGGGAAAGIGTATDSCVGCKRADQVTFFGNEIIAAIQQVTSATDNTTLLIKIKPAIALKANALVWASINGRACGLARFIDSTQELADYYDPETRAPLSVNFFVEISSSDEIGAQASSIVIDTAAKVVYACLSLRSVSRPSILAKFSMNGNFSLYGKRQLNYVSTQSRTTRPEVFSAMAVDADARLLYALVTGVSQLRLVTFLLYEVTSITPDIADQRAGTRITVTGLGFQPILNVSTLVPLYPVACQFGGRAIVQAENVSFTSLECVVTHVDNVSSASSACDGQATEVTLYGTQWFTENGVALKRAQSPRVDFVSPDRGGLAGGTRITVHGQGFIQSPYATCAFWSDNPLATEKLPPAPLQYISPNAAVCVQPAALEASYDNSYLNVSVDGQLYAEQGPVQYQIVGNPANLSSPGLITKAATKETLFAINITVVDSQRHFLGRLDTQNKSVCVLPNITSDECDVVQFSWRSENDGYPWPPCRNNTLRFTTGNNTAELLCRNTAQGLVSFSDLVFHEPRSSTMRISFHMADMKTYPWMTQTTIVVSEGAAHALAIANRKELVSVTIVNSQALTPPPEIIVVDALGNVLQTASSDLIVTAQTFYIKDESMEKVTTNSYTLTQRQDGNRIRFSQIFLKYWHGATHYIDFTSEPKLIATQSPPLRTSLCDNPSISYKVPDSSECKPCPPEGAVCNGTELIRVLPGYWRGNTSTYIYSCPSGPTVCLGSDSLRGSACEYGYKGPLCSQCISGFGHSGSTTCSECPQQGTSIALLLVAGVGALAVLLIWTTVTLRAPEVTDLTVIMRTVVNHMQATGKLGEFSTQWDPFLKSVFAVQSQASSVSVNGLSSLDCLLRDSGEDWTLVFTGYMLLPIISIVMAVGVFIVVRVMKMEPQITPELKAEIDQDIKSMGMGARTAILKTRYPFYMVATTTLCVNMFAIYQTLITQSTVVLQCRTFYVDDGVQASYLDVDMSIPCDASGNHKFRTAAMLCAIVYGFGIPAGFFFGYKFMNGRIGKPALTNMMFMFLIGGYKAEYWYWQVVIMVRKMILVLIIVFIGDNTQLQSYCGMWTMSVALIAQIWFQPNDKPEFNLVEALSLAIITVTLNLGLLYFWPDMPDIGKTTLTATLILITLGAGCMFVYFMYPPIKKAIQEELHGMVKKAKDLKHDLEHGSTNEEEEKRLVLSSKRLEGGFAFEDDDSDGGGVPLPRLGARAQYKAHIAFRPTEARTAVEPAFDEYDERPSSDDPHGVGIMTSSDSLQRSSVPPRSKQSPAQRPRRGPMPLGQEAYERL
jgi:hypothetical protein